MTRRIGLFGGTFDPVHLGHLHAAEVLLDEYSLSEIFFIPAYQPVHREQPLATSDQRLEMLQLCLSGSEHLFLDCREVNRGGASYALYTLQEYRSEYPEDELFFIIGTDAFNAIDSWHEWQSLFDYCHFIVLPRPGYTLQYSPAVQSHIDSLAADEQSEDVTPKTGQVLLSKRAMLELSATQVRTAIQNKQNITALISEKVAQYIEDHNIYAKDLLK